MILIDVILKNSNKKPLTHRKPNAPSLTSLNTNTLLSSIKQPFPKDRFFLLSNTMKDVEEEFHRNHTEIQNQRRMDVNNEYFNPDFGSDGLQSDRNKYSSGGLSSERNKFGKRMSHGRAGSTRTSIDRRGNGRKGHTRTLSRQRVNHKGKSFGNESFEWDARVKGRGGKLTGTSSRRIPIDRVDSATGKFFYLIITLDIMIRG